MTEQGSSTEQLVPTLGFGDLMGSAVGQIIGAGIMSLLPSALAITGRSVPFSFLVAAIITVCQAIPFIFISSVVRLRGGAYTQMSMLTGKNWVGMYSICYILSNVSLAMYGLSLGSYLCSLFNLDPSMEKIIALVVFTVFLGLNLLGLDAFAKVQNLLVIILIGSLLMFGIMGIGKVQWGTYFVQDEGWMLNGIGGMLRAGGLLTFATGGAMQVCPTRICLTLCAEDYKIPLGSLIVKTAPLVIVATALAFGYYFILSAFGL